jgi:hypothetical protein
MLLLANFVSTIARGASQLESKTAKRTNGREAQRLLQRKQMLMRPSSLYPDRIHVFSKAF